MTTIAFDGKIVAADRQSTYGSFPIRTKKIERITFRGKDAVVGCAGAIQEFDIILKWLRAGGKKKHTPNLVDQDKPDFSVMVCCSDGTVYYACNSMFFHEMGKTKWAIGTGADYALGAMYAGLPANEAVKISIKLDTNSGFGVDLIQIAK